MMRLYAAVLLAAVLYALRSFADPCGSPIAYRIGEVDRRFALGRGELEAALRRAEAVWEKPAGRELFHRVDDGALAVHLLYDERQRTADEVARRRDRIEEAGESADQIREKHRAASARYESLRRGYEKALAAQDARVAAHNREVEAWNARGGAPPEVLATLREVAEMIRGSGADLERSRVEVNEAAARANDLAKRHERLVSAVKVDVDAVNANAGREFHQGRYLRDLSGARIEIYEFGSTEDLVHVLAHELGHALGLEHVDDPDSIMYGTNSTEAVVVTAQDLAALRERCRL